MTDSTATLPFDPGYVHAYLKAALLSVEPDGLTDPQAAYFLEWLEQIGTADGARVVAPMPEKPAQQIAAALECGDTASSTGAVNYAVGLGEYTLSNPVPNNTIFYGPGNVEVFKIGGDGRLFWRSREVDTDDDLRAAMREVNDLLRATFGLPPHAQHVAEPNDGVTGTHGPDQRYAWSLRVMLTDDIDKALALVDEIAAAGVPPTHETEPKGGA